MGIGQRTKTPCHKPNSICSLGTGHTETVTK